MRILICEDETIIRLDVRTMLQRYGFDVCCEAQDGEEAVELARSLQPDLAIMDVRTPRLDGIEAARRIQAERPIPIVLLTAFSERRLVARAVDAGISGYVVKPFTANQLLPAIETAAARHDELLAARRELGRKAPDERPLDVVVVGRGESRWPLRITRDPSGEVEVSLLEEEQEGR
jgi:response regulator NasT